MERRWYAPDEFESDEHRAFWEWVDSDAPVDDRRHAVDLMCVLHSWAAIAGARPPGHTTDGFCDRHHSLGFLNTGGVVRFMARAVRDAVERERAQEAVRVH